MAQNSSSGVWACHFYTQYHLIRENLKEGIIKIEFVKSVENESDVFTKNVTQEIYKRHVKNFFKEYIQGECTMTERFDNTGNIPHVQFNLFYLLRKSIRDTRYYCEAKRYNRVLTSRIRSNYWLYLSKTRRNSTNDDCW